MATRVNQVCWGGLAGLAGWAQRGFGEQKLQENILNHPDVDEADCNSCRIKQRKCEPSAVLCLILNVMRGCS